MNNHSRQQARITTNTGGQLMVDILTSYFEQSSQLHSIALWCSQPLLLWENLRSWFPNTPKIFPTTVFANSDIDSSILSLVTAWFHRFHYLHPHALRPFIDFRNQNLSRIKAIVAARGSMCFRLKHLWHEGAKSASPKPFFRENSRRCAKKNARKT